MFSSQKNKQPEHEEPKKSFDIQTMPEIFYGGKDPEIYHHAPHKQSTSTPLAPETSPVVTPPPVVAPPRTAQQSAVQKSPPPTHKKHHSVVILFVVGILILAAVSWYYVSTTLRQMRDANTPQPIAPIFNNTTSPNIPSVTTSTNSSSSSSENIPTSTPSRVAFDFPRTTFSKAVDTDTDELTDQEEEVFGTDSGTWDTDEDGYYDGQELANLYNPKGFAPKRLIDSGLVREYINPAFQYRVYYPLGWEVASVDPTSEQVLISTITGDYIEVRTVLLDPNISFTQWFATEAVGQQFSDLRQINNRFDIPVSVRRDGLVAYVIAENHVFVLIYHPGTQQQILYPNIMNMVVQSFRPNRVFVDIPEQTVLPTTTPLGEQTTSSANTSSSTL